MARKKIKISRGSLFAKLLLASAILLFIPQRHTSKINWLFFEAFDPILKFAQGKRPDFFDAPASKDIVFLQRECNTLRKEYANTLAKLAKVHEDYEKLSRVRTNLPNENIGIVMADIIKKSFTGRRELIINKGSLDELETGLYVLAEEGNCVIGTVCEVSNSQARVKLITDAKHSMPVLIWRKGAPSAIEAQLIGDGSDSAKIPLMSRNDDIKAGDFVFSAPKVGFIESRIPIGKVSEVSKDRKTAILLDITVKPYDDFSDIKTVAVVVMNSDLRNK